MNYRTSRKVMWVSCALLFVVFAVAGMVEQDQVWMCWGALSIPIVGVLQIFRYYRCPHCDESLANVKGRIPSHCPHCGRELK